MDLFLPRDDVMVVTSEDVVLRDRGELEGFLERYARSSTTYSWEWEPSLVAVEGDVAWLLAEGIETATTPSGGVRTPYRMTLMCLHRDRRWRIAQVHGSSPDRPCRATSSAVALRSPSPLR